MQQENDSSLFNGTIFKQFTKPILTVEFAKLNFTYITVLKYLAKGRPGFDDQPVAWREQKFKYFFYKYFCLVLGYLNPEFQKVCRGPFNTYYFDSFSRHFAYRLYPSLMYSENA